MDKEQQTEHWTLFAPENKVIQGAEKIIEENQSNELVLHYTQLLEQYKKLHNKLMSLVNISDAQQGMLSKLKNELLEKNQQLEQANQALQNLSLKDPLTELANRRYFDEFLDKEWARLTRYKRPLSLLMIDIDFFKPYNDEYGHQQGDNCLKLVASTLRGASKRSVELVARYGGEEFALILPETEPTEAEKIARIIHSEINALKIPHTACPNQPYLSLSIGISTVLPTRDKDPAVLIKAADEALYQAKKSGRNKISIFQTDSQIS